MSSTPFKTRMNPESLRHFNDALGYAGLKMFRDAWESLQRVSAEHDEELAVVLLKAEVLNSLGRYSETLLLLGPFVPEHPQCDTLIIQFAFATRRADSLDKAYQILHAAVTVFPKTALILYNYACYCAQLGQHRTALDFLKRAIELEPPYVRIAQEDEDFLPLCTHPEFIKLTTP
ncbi:MAG: tetratricopeptide repeat protein [Verrucomicrobiae bacterium]|nr:tetratricopeptide repeat protein [Verrucomicrobiae bacterium]